ncbi:ABC transporter permease [Lysinibacillus yapensis]|uniref:ABC transporter permease n=1 Tax=Ureibacillus yapensis TaxID=2304605 RepID=A0A396S7F1_9BACL|nr:ABC transporter permease [Lysinibacillus yapensis]RHW36785.1 ABC transporter permease [Lysinibacillus yapensis]
MKVDAQQIAYSNVDPIIEKRKRKPPLWLKGFVLPAVVIAVWQLIAGLGFVSETVLPSPLLIVQSFISLTLSGEIFGHLKISILRALCGFLLGAGIGLTLGLIVGFSKRSEGYIDPTMQILRTIPNLAVTPLFILWFGFDELSKILLIAFASFFPIYVNTFNGIRSVDAKLFDVARVLEFSKGKQLTRLIFPASLSSILLGIRLSLGAAWLSLVVAELMGSSSGVGYMIMDARQFSQTEKVFVGIIIFGIVGKLTDSFVKILEKRLLKWRNSFDGVN